MMECRSRMDSVHGHLATLDWASMTVPVGGTASNQQRTNMSTMTMKEMSKAMAEIDSRC
jgi:hypothetical protein